MDPIKILKRSWQILWSYRTLWVFGFILALAGAGTYGNNNFNYRTDRTELQNNQPIHPEDLPRSFHEAIDEVRRWFDEGTHISGITPQELRTLLWIIAAFILILLIVSIIVAIARYVSETAVIRMVDEYEASGSKMTLRQGLGIGWSRTSWRLFLINLLVNLPGILVIAMVLGAGIVIYMSLTRGNEAFAIASVITMIGVMFLVIFLVAILSIVLRLLRQFFWRVCVLEDADVSESLRRGFATVRENWKNVGLMWLVMIGLGIAWAIVSFIAVIITIPVVIVTGIIGAIVAGIPALLLVGAFSLFLSGPLPWIIGILFVLPLFFVIAFSPWILLGSWQTVFTSSVWTLTYREIKALPALTAEARIEPVGD
jgi:hypothetical protein